jgi:hypothetical protein
MFWDWPEETIRDTSGVYMMSGVNRNCVSTKRTTARIDGVEGKEDGTSD